MVRGLITTQDTTRPGRGPSQPRSLKFASEVLRVEAIEVCVQILPSASGNRRPGPSSSSRAGGLCTFLHRTLEDETTIEGMVLFVHSPAINLRQQYERQRLEHAFRRINKQVAHSNQKTILP